ncbi:MAG: trypsin-like peptidase domain-containing protein [Terracidiphilus sp.]
MRIAKLVGPAVVNINTQTLPKQSDNGGHHNFHQFRSQPNQQNPGDNQDNNQNDQQGPDNFQDFFNRFFGGQAPGPDEGGDNGQVQESLGSGFIVDSKGYIITNDHVIDKADKIYVKLSTDPDSQDLGPSRSCDRLRQSHRSRGHQIDTGTPLPTVKLGNSDTAQVGDWVEAIGSPFALAQTVTAGIISAKDRTIDQGQAGQFQHFLQTDAAINPATPADPCST